MSESLPAFGLADVEERESAAVLVSAGETRRCACGRVKLGDLVVHREDACLPLILNVVADGIRPVFPAPLVTSRDPWDGVTGAPSSVLKLAERARASSWVVGVQRSRGCAPHASHGAPGAVKWRYAVRLGRVGANAYAVYDAEAEAWKSVMLWGDARTWFALASVTDLEEYIRAGGMMDDSWYDTIRERVRVANERKKTAAVSRPKTKREGMS